MKWLSESSVNYVHKAHFGKCNYGSDADFIVYRNPCPVIQGIDWLYDCNKHFMNHDRSLVFKMISQRHEVPTRKTFFTFRSDKIRPIGVHPFDKVEVVTPMLVLVRDRKLD